MQKLFIYLNHEEKAFNSSFYLVVLIKDEKNNKVIWAFFHRSLKLKFKMKQKAYFNYYAYLKLKFTIYFL
jgi:hypothetical protein